MQTWHANHEKRQYLQATHAPRTHLSGACSWSLHCTSCTQIQPFKISRWFLPRSNCLHHPNRGY